MKKQTVRRPVIKTAAMYQIINFQELEKPVFMKKCDRPMIYKGTVIEKNKEMIEVYWDRYGRCANPMYNDYFINPYYLIDLLHKKLENANKKDS